MPTGIGAGHCGTDEWNEKWERYQKMKKYGRINEQCNKIMYRNKLLHNKGLPSIDRTINNSTLSRTNKA
jgi:hypothetical protein